MNATAEKQESIDYYDLWKYYNDVGSRDKDRMITIVTWHLGTVILIIGYLATHLDTIRLASAVILTALSILICLVSIFWIYAFASYANRCWDVADRCEDHIAGLEQFTDKEVFIGLLETTKTRVPLGRLDQKIMRRLLRMNHKPREGLIAPYKILLLITLFMIAVSIVVFALSIRLPKDSQTKHKTRTPAHVQQLKIEQP